MAKPIAERPVILIVEDEPLVREMIVVELEDAGFQVVQAESGEQALAALEQEPRIDLVFTDIRLSGRLDGWDVAERARRRDEDVAVIYATGYSASEGRRVPGGLVLTKPYRAAAVLEAAETLGIKVPDARS